MVVVSYIFETAYANQNKHTTCSLFLAWYGLNRKAWIGPGPAWTVAIATAFLQSQILVVLLQSAPTEQSNHPSGLKSRQQICGIERADRFSWNGEV